ncbi:glycosyltransferase family 2 protein [Rothia terrae]|uniref:glycosyltransferase family 2 protein n=1 Tax=Rothia terrae TaxID=396015 RepID=UPI0033E65CBD
MTSPRTSIIMPVYNTANSVVTAIESVLKQTDLDFELLIINDHSPDNADEVIKKYLEITPDNRIRYITNHKNLGLAATRNRGMKIARGQWLAFIDSDDAYKPSFLETLHASATDDIDIVACGLETVYEDGTRKPRPGKLKGTFTGREAMITLMRDELTPYACNKIFRKSAVGSQEFPLINRVEDAGFSIAVYKTARYVKEIEDRLYLYTVNPLSITWGSTPPITEMNRFMDYLKDTTGAHEGDEEEQNALAVSWVLTYLNGAQSALRLNPETSGSYLGECRKALRLPIIQRAIKSGSMYGVAAVLLKVSPWIYRKVYRLYIKRTYGL